MILKYSFQDTGDEEKLIAYQQGVMDIAAYNSALLKVAAPSTLGLEGDNGKKADAYFKQILNCANNWMQVIHPHCRIVPETILLYDWSFKANMETLKQGLETLIENPEDQKTRESLAEMLTEMGEVMASYQKDILELIDGIETYFKDMNGSVTSFNTLLDIVAKEIKLDEEKKTKLQAEIAKTTKELWDARQRLQNDEKLLKSTWFIIVSILAFGIPLLVIGVDKLITEKKVRLKETELSTFRSDLADTEKLLLALYAARAAYEKLLSNIESILKTSDVILGVWRKFSKTCTDFAEKIVGEEALFEEEKLKEALEEVKTMELSWQEISALAGPLSQIQYEIVQLKSNAA